MAPPSPKQEIPINVNGQDFGTLVIEPRAEHEAAEIWESIEMFTIVGGAMGIATVFLMSMMIAHLLKPIRLVGDALMQLDAGRYNVAVPETGPPEIADICRKLNRFAATLERTISENRRLAQRIICVQDEERKDLARELHDELGPYLFAIRAAVAVLQTEIERGAHDRTKLLEACATLVERMEMIQRTNRRVLHKLRPMGLEEFGLKAKLGGLVALLQESHAGVDITLTVADDLPSCDETSVLTIYRLAQEGLTNAVKHAGASAIDIAVEPADPEHTPNNLAHQSTSIVQVTIADDGKGLPEDIKPSYGIAGMSERVWATGGELRLSSSAGNGVTLEAWIPVLPAASDTPTASGASLQLSTGAR
jgi:two-component system sensor histidine kinase UhpB